MANLRCAECGRYVNDPEDHDPGCSLYKKNDVYVKDEPDVVHNDPDVDPTPDPVPDPSPDPTPDPKPEPSDDVETKSNDWGKGDDAPYLPKGEQ